MRSGLTLLLSVVGLLSASTTGRVEAETAAQSGLPRVVLVGDSIRLGYAPRVTARLAGKAVVVSPPANGGDSATFSHISTSGLSSRSPTSCT